ncbi:hypothetical protein [Acidobacterium sp. S8]|uniref:hypothetical protein n=1 Tax=Acidobacterium sp. S8 TaxID=1641854 RepID=UPI00131A9B82|nr:hypothetical protein [Acidobacterium sp. S8]
MSREKLTSIFLKLVLAAITMSGMSALSTQNAGAQTIIVTTPVAFIAGSQSYPAGTYEFTLLSAWTLSIRNVNGGGQRFVTVRPEDDSRLGSKGSVTFDDSDGRQTLEAVYVPGTGRTAELLRHNKIDDRANSDSSLASLHKAGKQNATGR